MCITTKHNLRFFLKSQINGLFFNCYVSHLVSSQTELLFYFLKTKAPAGRKFLIWLCPQTEIKYSLSPNVLKDIITIMSEPNAFIPKCNTDMYQTATHACLQWTYNEFWSLYTACPLWPTHTKRHGRETSVHLVSFRQEKKQRNCQL